MQAQVHSISNVLSLTATSFFIPPFQRAYAWGKTEIERYFSDIKKILQYKDEPKQLEHFFGTLVVKSEINGFNNIYKIIDGQQRLTTTLIFLIALRDNLTTDNNEINHINQTYLFTSNGNIKLTPVIKDYENYQALVNKQITKPSIIKTAYDIFCNLINDYKKQFSEVILQDFIYAIKKLNVAVIFLEEDPFKGEDPQIIFETLNSLGKPLTLSDLIRNYVLLNFPADKQTKIYETLWFPKIEQPLGDKSSEFFRDFLQYKTQKLLKVVSNNSTKEIYAEFKNYIATKYKDNTEFINDIISYAPLYKLVITEENKVGEIIKNAEIIELLRNIFWDIKSEAFKPFVLGMLFYYNNKKLSDNILIDSLKTIRTYLIRRRIMKLTLGENKTIPTLSKFVDDLANKKITMLELLTNLAFATRFPNDTEVRKKLTETPLYEESKSYIKFIFGKIEKHNTKVSVNFRDPKITIEHIMPQKLTEDWQNMLGENFEDTHKEYLHNIGNLILTEFNSEMGNKPFDEKQIKLKKSNLNFRNEILNAKKWSKLEIKNHQGKMIDDFLTVFDLPQQFQLSSNWNQIVKDQVFNDEISPLDDEASTIVTGSKPKSIIIDDQIFKVSNWQDVLITFLKFIRDDDNFGLDKIFNNQTKIFGKKDGIITWEKLEQKIQHSEDVKNRYKSFDGLFAYKIKNIKNNELFININISAKNCIEIIANIMNEFDINEDFVKISIN